MAGKRKSDAIDVGATSRERKKAKVSIARTIAVQPKAGPSGSTESSKTNGLGRLPGAIDVEKFAEARAFEIDAMQKAMKNASSSSTQRAWQALPRHLRRRAASHDVRRVPVRLREKARAEMDPISRKTSSHSVPKLGKGKRVSRTETFLKRQSDKAWLETHVWHAKRMLMENKWGYRLALHPTEKAFRPSHRASIQGSILHDASYFSLIELNGPENVLKATLESCCDPQGQGPGAKRYIGGSRALETFLYKFGSYPFDLIASIQIIWKALEPRKSSAATEAEKSGTRTEPSNKGKEKAAETSVSNMNEDPERPRVVWLRSHPSVFKDVFSALQSSISFTLESFKNTYGNSKVFNVEMVDLRGQMNVFEIMGPKSNQILKGALKPVQEDKNEFTRFWDALGDLQTSGSIPRGMVVGFKVNDPRLDFPPKNAKMHCGSPSTVFPTSALAYSEIWNESTRSKLLKPRFKKKDLDERRAKNLIPGTSLKPLRQDDRIPVLLIQRSIENSSNEDRSIHGWTLIIPAGWAMAFFNSLVFTGTRVGGLRERQTQAFEANSPYFPRDYPSSLGYAEYSEEREKEERERWQQKPPAKRVNFAKLGSNSPFAADWKSVLGMSRTQVEVEDELVMLVTTQRSEAPGDEGSAQNAWRRIWLLRGPETKSIVGTVSSLFDQAAGLFQEINKLRSKRRHDPLDVHITADELLKGALILVKLKVCKRGVPEDLAMIYEMEDDEVNKWKKALCQTAEDETMDELTLSKQKPSEKQIIGYVTTGHFSLSHGEGSAVGGVSLTKLFDLQQQALRMHSNKNINPSLLVKFRNKGSQQCRAAYLELIDS